MFSWRITTSEDYYLEIKNLSPWGINVKLCSTKSTWKKTLRRHKLLAIHHHFHNWQQTTSQRTTSLPKMTNSNTSAESWIIQTTHDIRIFLLMVWTTTTTTTTLWQQTNDLLGTFITCTSSNTRTNFLGMFITTCTSINITRLSIETSQQEGSSSASVFLCSTMHDPSYPMTKNMRTPTQENQNGTDWRKQRQFSSLISFREQQTNLDRSHSTKTIADTTWSSLVQFYTTSDSGGGNKDIQEQGLGQNNCIVHSSPLIPIRVLRTISDGTTVSVTRTGQTFHAEYHKAQQESNGNDHSQRV